MAAIAEFFSLSFSCASSGNPSHFPDQQLILALGFHGLSYLMFWSSRGDGACLRIRAGWALGWCFQLRWRVRAPLPAQDSWGCSCPGISSSLLPAAALSQGEQPLPFVGHYSEFNKMFADARRRQFSLALFHGIVHAEGEQLFRNVLKPFELLWCPAKDFTRWLLCVQQWCASSRF